MKAFTIPTVYTAVDKFTNPLGKMTSSSKGFTNSIARQERLFRKLTPALSETSKQFLSFASAAAVSAAIISSIVFSWQSLKDYETAITNVRTITGLSIKDFQPFKNEISEVAIATKESAIEVAKSFELIASANADLLKSPAALGAVSKAAITLSQAANMSIEDAASALTNSMNQFGVGADKAQDFINILVTSQAAGTATVRQLSESLVVAGGTAKAFGLDFDKTNALLQGFAKGGKVGSEAGTMLSGVLSKLSKTNIKEFNPVNTDAIKVIDNLSKANLSYTQLMKLTDVEGAKWLTTLINQNKTVQELAGNQNKANAAADAAANQTNTLSEAFRQAQNAYVNLLISNEDLGFALNVVKSTMQFVANNMGLIVGIGASVIGVFAAWKVLIIAQKIYLFGFNVALGIYNALTGKAVVYSSAQTVAMKAQTAAQWLLNAAMTANPIGLIIVGIVALIALITAIIVKWDEWGAAVSFLLGPLGFVISLIQSFRRNWDMITEAFKTGGILAGLKAIGKTILDAVLMPIQQVLQLIARFTGADWASNAVQKIESFRAEMGVNTAVNPKASEQESMRTIIKENNNNATVNWTVNDPNRWLKPEATSNGIPVKTGSTLGNWHAPMI